MMITTDYLGLQLANPLLASSSPYTSHIDNIRRLADQGIGGVVLKSVFEEQIAGEAAMLERYHSYPEAAAYLKTYVGEDYMRSHLALIREAKTIAGLPVIASINCVEAGEWLEYARRIQEAGADALELNVFEQPASVQTTSSQIETDYARIVASVVETIRIPVSVKLGMRFTNVFNLARELYYRGARGVVYFNRFFEPDIDLDTISLVPGDPYSSAKELRNVLRTTALGSALLPGLDISVSSGVHSGEDVVKAILTGAKTVQLCTAIHERGMGVIGEMLAYMQQWMNTHRFEGIGDFRGLLDYRSVADPQTYQRVQYMKYFPSEQ